MAEHRSPHEFNKLRKKAEKLIAESGGKVPGVFRKKDIEELNDELSIRDLVGLTSSEIFAKIEKAYLYPHEAITHIKEIVNRGQPVKGEEVAMRGEHELLRDFIPMRVNGKSYGRLWYHTDITERKRAEEALKRNLQRLDILSDTAGQLLMSHAPQQVIEVLCRRVMEHLDCHAFFNYLVDDQRNCLRLNAYAGIHQGNHQADQGNHADHDQHQGQRPE
jgi:PAS domain-containing protein